MIALTVSEFIRYSIDENWQTFTLYDVDKGEEVFTGTIDDCPYEYLDAEIGSFDLIDKDCPRLVLNVSIED